MRFTPAAKRRAYDAGHWEIVKFWTGCGAYQMLAYGPYMPDLQAHTMIPTRDVATLVAFGRSDWLHAVYGPSIAKVARPQVDHAFKTAVQFGHVGILATYEADFVDARHGYDDLLEVAATHGQTGVLQWLLYKSRILFGPKGKCLYSCLLQSLKHRHLHLALWLVEHPIVRVHFSESVDDRLTLARLAIECGGVKLLSLIHAIGLVDNHAGEDLLSFAAKQGHVDVFEWWFATPGLDLPPMEGTIEIAMRHSKLQVLDWLLGTPLMDKRISVKEDMLNELIVERHVDTLRWLKRNADKIQIKGAGTRQLLQRM
ncbi:hypothetical protein BCR44DRAFT_42494 [Catenaria anguillulae PL171]|uniref:Ankyrin repeat-containing domain protein n=1 Tax=Catenaria anguillulae PL171 TaxID=765915 RepID=A0A1Y2HXZ5_9FUNG|nr:hypothetical protein BCR44DRAFT_42494 [Catenaria anguillulae PL171]